jgi:hypothetical protein
MAPAERSTAMISGLREPSSCIIDIIFLLEGNLR